ncbi:hypothetical protein PROFUN_07966 [Planoprotostelium fungivorum]|uniref:CMP/dCMP-type deaminase domain-containing protein n=1 Tax=Planoprotostelium fungivorum TaxID=1890364 RepID=A0A2P6NL97_9EUKA|nr:hypothetical protein PROFUN_07966 [Planoprotostelium fungivorum]
MSNNSDEETIRTQIKAVLSAEELSSVVYEDVIVTLVKEPKNISELLKKRLSEEHFPCRSLSHVKRVRKDRASGQVYLLLCTTEQLKSLSSIRELEEMSSLFPNAFSKYQLSLSVQKVPKTSPLTLDQFNEWSLLWPLTLHKHEISTPPPSLFSKEQLRHFDSFMQQTIALSHVSRQGVACLVVDPTTMTVVATGKSDITPMHPLKHAIMDAVSNVAQHQLEEVRTRKKRRTEVQYLCTGYDLYVTSAVWLWFTHE